MDDHPAAAKQPPLPEDEPIVSPFLVGPDEPSPAVTPRRRGLPIDFRALAAALAPRRGGLPIGIWALAAVVILTALVLWGISPRNRSVESPEAAGRVLDPIRPHADARTGEQVAPFSGFAVSVDTDPPGAVVSVGGVPRGEAPVLAGLDCAPGDPVEISAQRAGFAVARASTTCRRDALVKLTVRLVR